MDFATLPPEISSAHIHAGPGAASMTEAAAAWGRLATRLFTAAADYRVVAAKAARGARGVQEAACSQATARAAAYLDWLTATAVRAEQAADRAGDAARAYACVRSATVPPPVIADNRRRLRSLTVTNSLGQTSAAIADTESDYERMWAHNTEAMHAYATQSADASTLETFTPPPVTRAVPARAPWPQVAAPQVVAAGSEVVSAIPGALRAFAASPVMTFDQCLLPTAAALSQLGSLTAPQGEAIRNLNALNKAAALRWLLPNQGGARGPVITAKSGRGASVGALSVPGTWPNAVPAEPPRGWLGEPIGLPGVVTEG